MLARIKSARRGLLVLGLKGGEALVGAAMTIYLARIMGPSEFGFFAFGLAITTLLAIPIKNGASTLITKHVAMSHDGPSGAASPDHLAGPLLSTGIRLSLLYAGLVLAVLWGARVAGMDNPFWASVSMLGLALPVLCLTGLWEGVLRGSFKPNVAIIVGTVLVPLIVLAIAVVFTSSLRTQGWPMAAGLYVGSAAGVCLLAYMWARDILKSLLPVPSEDRVGMVDWLAHAAPFAIVTGLLVFNRQIDVILLGILQDEDSAGIYRLAAQGAVLVTFGVQAVGHLYAPYMAKADTTTAPDALSGYLRRSVLFSVVFGVLALGFLALWGDEIIVLLAGPEFLPGYPVMLILCAANLAVALNGATLQALYMQGFQTRAAKIFAAVAIYTVLANASLIPLYGLYGAACATASAIVLWSLGVRTLACRTWRLSFFTLTTQADGHST